MSYYRGGCGNNTNKSDLQESSANRSIGIPFGNLFSQASWLDGGGGFGWAAAECQCHRCSRYAVLGGRSQQTNFFGLEFVPRSYGIDNRQFPVMGL